MKVNPFVRPNPHARAVGDLVAALSTLASATGLTPTRPHLAALASYALAGLTGDRRPPLRPKPRGADFATFLNALRAYAVAVGADPTDDRHLARLLADFVVVAFEFDDVRSAAR